ncbi:hypothetical protein GCM10009555_031830 [Acrocarpospora macrocephala]|uniref:DUF4253 domain-containing protein n=1 Tax=Acrocarpospora macrocephala TaxID=150177 RepID=A0A5M3WUD8_9ACTN|nr:DUF4253 domain-containing protein [Acrocarpospora macrocephala]GES12514.1 hypothetical protein Amac_061110 [Acrocarpospora macrocephala]
MRDIVSVAGLELYPVEEFQVLGESVLVVHVTGDGQQLWRQVRTALPDFYPILVLDRVTAFDVDYVFSTDPRNAPSDVLARAAEVDVYGRIAEISARYAPRDVGTGEEGYNLDGYDIAHFGVPQDLVILPRPQPWAAFAYLNSYYSEGHEPELLVAAAHRWYDRYGAEPTVVGLATGFVVSRPPTDLADAERLAAEHMFFAGLTAQTSERAYARALRHLDRWALYDRP